jgi:hypothetical protein
MLQSSVAVFGTVQENGKVKPVSRGGGFLIDNRHVIQDLGSTNGTFLATGERFFIGDLRNQFEVRME